MGSSETGKTSKERVKEPKTPPTTQKPSSVTSTGTVNPDWSGFQAYSPIPPHGFMASSPQAHPYMWGVQHIMPPYGTPPPPYVAMYSPGGIYAHPSMPPGSYPFSPFAMPSPNGLHEASATGPGSIEVNGKPSEVKDKLPIKRSKGSLGSLNMFNGRNNELGKTGVSTNESYSKSVESGSEGSSEGSDANSQNDSQLKSLGRQDSFEAEPSQNGSDVNCPHSGGLSTNHTMVNPTNVIPISTSGTNLNIGMDYWGAQGLGKVPSVPSGGALATTGARDGAQSQLWMQDERELKRQRRKQSNRESARRSRLRKQAECDELAQRAEALTMENATLRAEVSRIRREYEQLLSVNASLKERIGEAHGHEDVGSAKNDQHFGDDS